MSADEEPDDEDFEQLLEASLEPATFEPGQTVEGRIVALDDEVAFVDVGGKGEATIDLVELADDDGTVDVEVGDVVQGVVVSTEGGLRLSHRLARGAASRERLADAFRAGLPVEGRVEAAIRGGFDVRIAGQRAFCPISQIDTAFTSDPEAHVGHVLTFRIVELGSGGRNLVVSRRAILEEEERARAAEVRRTLVPGAVVPGRVASVVPYGAFVDLGGGIQGLLHVSEMGWSRVADPAQVVQAGDEITVAVLGVDEEKGRISLGLKPLQADPWKDAAEHWRPGRVVRGTVTRIAEFGAFVELAPGIEALAHASSFAPTGRRDGWKEGLGPGVPVAVEVLDVDAGRRRIGVAVVEEGTARAASARDVRIEPGARVAGKVERHERYGVFVHLAPGRTGLIPLAETGVAPGADLARAFPVGSDVDVIVLEVDTERRRIRLSRKAVLAAAERSEAREYAGRQERGRGEGFGSLADKLRAALKKD